MPLSEEEGAGAPLAAEVVRFVQETLNLGTAVDTCLPEELRGVEGMQQLHATLWGIRRLAWALSRGELRFSTDQRGFVVGALKALQADLRHLTWQAQRIADGEYGHRVHFLGDFSTAFNRMILPLQGTVLPGRADGPAQPPGFHGAGDADAGRRAAGRLHHGGHRFF